MEDKKRTASDSLINDLQKKPFNFDFFQAVRRIECANQNLPKIGCAHHPQDDPLRFCQNVSLGFAPSALAAFYEATEQHPARMVVNFMGLLGPGGPMPQTTTEYVYDRLHNHRDPTLSAFLDIFNHRMISLFYRTWAINQQTVSHDRKDEDRFAVYIGSLFGIGGDSFRNRDDLPDTAKLYYSGRLVSQSKNTEGLEGILEDYFGIAVKIQEFVGQWIDLPQDYLCRLGTSNDNSRLGSTLILGHRFWECQQKFRIKIGPMGFCEYKRFLPGSSSISRLKAWIRNYIGEELQWELQLILKAKEIPNTCLGRKGRVGWSTWLGTSKLKKNPEAVTLNYLDAHQAS